MSEGISGPGDRPPRDTSRGPADGSGGAAARRAQDGVGGTPAPGGIATGSAGSRSAGLAYGGLAAAVLGLILFVAAAILAFTASLVVVTFFGGRIVGLSVRSGTRASEPPTTRTLLAIVLTLAALVLALVATWAFARLTGGVLDLPTYLLETLGPVVPISVVLGTIGAWWGAG